MTGPIPYDFKTVPERNLISNIAVSFPLQLNDQIPVEFCALLLRITHLIADNSTAMLEQIEVVMGVAKNP